MKAAPRFPKERPPADPADVGSVDTVVPAMFAAISGPAGTERNWSRFRSLFAPGARLMVAFPGEEGRREVKILSPDEYVSSAKKHGWFGEGFFETETGHVTERYGNIAHRFGSYVAYRSEDDDEPLSRGVTSTQLVKEDDGWRVLSFLWQDAADAGPVPDRYLDNP